MIIIININKILISGTLISYTTKLSNRWKRCCHLFKIPDLDTGCQSAFCNSGGKVVWACFTPHGHVIIIIIIFNYYERTQDIMEMKKLEIIS